MSQQRTPCSLCVCVSKGGNGLVWGSEISGNGWKSSSKEMGSEEGLLLLPSGSLGSGFVQLEA